MRLSRSRHLEFTDLIGYVRVFIAQRVSEIIGIITLVAVIATSIALVTWSAQDPSLNQAINRPVNNFMGHPGAILSDILMQLFGLASLALVAPAGFLGLKLVSATKINYIRWRLFFWVIGALSTAAILGALPIIGSWPLPIGLGGIVGDAILAFIASLPPVQGLPIKPFALLAFGLFALLGLAAGSGVSFSRKSSFDDEIEADDEWSEEDDSEVAPSLTDRFKNIFAPFVVVGRVIANLFSGFRSSDDATEATRERRSTRREPGFDYEPSSEIEQIEDEPVVEPRRPRAPVKTSKPKKSSTQLELYTFPPVGLLTEAKKSV
ncbi:MAG: hypothetical protein EBU00_11110, partial [Alphaproteobacteria bacterium]|nr:hypothetical protein [Alphaproteobacteria bacterium]